MSAPALAMSANGHRISSTLLVDGVRDGASVLSEPTDAGQSSGDAVEHPAVRRASRHSGNAESSQCCRDWRRIDRELRCRRPGPEAPRYQLKKGRCVCRDARGLSRDYANAVCNIGKAGRISAFALRDPRRTARCRSCCDHGCLSTVGSETPSRPQSRRPECHRKHGGD